MSAEELEARIGKLSADIEIQKKTLRQLERQKSLAQRELNAIRDPVSRLPLELSSQIFLHCRPRARPNPRFAPILFLNICNAWTDIALSLPELWSTIYIDVEVDDGPQYKILEPWCQRAGTYPLFIHVRTSLHYNLACSLTQFADRIKYLSLYQKDIDKCCFDELGLLPSLGVLEVRVLQFPHKGYLDVHALSCSAIIKLLRLTPNVLECKFDGFITEDLERPTQLLTLSCLRSLELRDDPDKYALDEDNMILMHHLTLPALREIYLPLHFPGFASFLRRSLPPLQKLTISELSHNHFPDFAESLYLIPTLTCLRLDVALHAESSVTENLLSTLAQSPFDLLPDLSILKIDFGLNVSESCYAAFLHMASLRRSTLVRASLVQWYSLETQPKPDANVCAELQRLIGGGMDLHIGPSRQNWILG
ncbi:F-box domain-containing protein [Favolaschia claudopus]|uniref:F-box domain-containing protein n=1 Tax=Favolaschia claudopus TaxID=2862362 RepID=A0AAW0CC16_9AGAR